MAAASDEPRARVPTPEDLARIGRALNEQGARYAVIGGFAMIHHGLARGTMDIDLLVDPSPENVERIRQALSILEDQASLEVDPTDVQSYTVVRIADEVVVDLLAEACGVRLADVEGQIEMAEVLGVPVPYLSASVLLLTKRTIRPKDAFDRQFLERLIQRRSETSGA